MVLFFLLVCVTTQVNALTDPLPYEESILKHDLIKCMPGHEFQWEKTEPDGNNLKLTYSCAGSGKREKEYSCESGYKASSKRDVLCDPGPDPNFGIFRGGKDPNVMDSARIVYFCMKKSVNNLPRCK
ncbi:uncharacterized protein LOC100198912 isoform X2 [Hydra vulgaris]|uniref:Uncharacterized protein LOC100198912 isoform X2 n=1 Tax=Hydra vulgaris TaxID=6087 RepID=A0ABM4D400_HYDVU